jgi:serine/threonine protein kinase/Flp pilus assembly protein TadD
VGKSVIFGRNTLGVMSANRDREEEIFDAARELADDERAAYLAGRCGQDADLRQRIEGMLEADAAAGDFFKTHDARPSTVIVADASLSPSIEKSGDKIGRYKLLQQIGEGGCGVVYMAEQEEPVRRCVALKVIKLGMDTKQVIARFEAERQALALMDHPNIARVLDAGATETGRPYFVMELVRGTKITEFCDQKELPTQERLDLFLQVCSAIQHAHQKGIIHRDIKPSNILVTAVDGVPVPKVIDFGIAKATNNQPLTDKTVFTAFEQFIGTPAYMSPEQAELSGVDIDTRTDIYSLGVVLYELLTGSPPFDQKELLAAGLDEMRRIIRETEPPRPSNRLSTMAAAALTATAHHRHTESPRLVHSVRGDLDWIAMKCLEKDRARRYETANALAADIRRHLDCEPVVARPPSRWYEFQKTVRRHKFGFAAATALVLVLMLGVGISTWQAVRATRAKKETAETLKQVSAERDAKEQARKAATDAEQRQTTLRTQAEQSQKNERAMRNKVGSEMNLVGIQFMSEGKLDVAEVVLRRALALHKELLSNDAGNTIVAAGNLAELLNSQGRQKDAEAIVDDLLPPAAENRMESFGTLCFRAQYRVHTGRFADAAVDMTKALKLKPDDWLAWLRLATIFVQGGDLNGYDQLRQNMLARFGTWPEPRFAEVTAKTCLLLPWSEANSNRVHQLADLAARELPAGKWEGLAKGLSEFRQGRFDSAAEWERRALAASDSDATVEVAAGALLAMTQHRLGRFDEAMNALTEADAIAAKQMARLSPMNTFEGNWHNILVAKILLREATEGFIQILQQERQIALGRSELPRLRLLTELLQSSGRWDEALPLLSECSTRDPEDTILSLRLAIYQAWFGKHTEHSASSRRLLQYAKDTTNAFTADRAAKAFCVRPSSDAALLAEALSLARRAVELGRDTNAMPYFHLALGLAEYRNGHLPEADKALAVAEESGKGNSHVQAPAQLFRAMSLFRQGRTNEAQRLFADPSVVFRAPPSDERNPFMSGGNHDDMITWLALKEAKALLQP